MLCTANQALAPRYGDAALAADDFADAVKRVGG